jgi:hypothetical protein
MLRKTWVWVCLLCPTEATDAKPDPKKTFAALRMWSDWQCLMLS